MPCAQETNHVDQGSKTTLLGSKAVRTLARSSRKIDTRSLHANMRRIARRQGSRRPGQSSIAPGRRPRSEAARGGATTPTNTQRRGKCVTTMTQATNPLSMHHQTTSSLFNGERKYDQTEHLYESPSQTDIRAAASPAAYTTVTMSPRRHTTPPTKWRVSCTQ